MDAHALMALGEEQSERGEHDAALATWAEAVARCGAGEEELAAWVLDARSELLWTLGRLPEALADVEELERRFAPGTGGLRRYVARAARRRAAVLLGLGRPDDVVDVARALLVEHAGDEDEATAAAVRAARFELGAALMERGDQAEALVVLEAFLSDLGSDGDVRSVVRARMARALALHQGERPDEAAQEYERLLEHPALEADEHLASTRMRALVNLPDAYARAGDEAAMLDAHRRFLEAVAGDVEGRFGVLRAEVAGRDAEDPMTRVQTAMLDLKEAATLAELEREEDAARLLAALIARWEGDELPDVVGAVALARQLLEELGDE